jgi:hypothetical protein
VVALKNSAIKKTAIVISKYTTELPDLYQSSGQKICKDSIYVSLFRDV